MAVKTSQHIIKGMQRDISVSKFNPEFTFDAQNIRITARDNNTLLSVTNERGNKELLIKDSTGKVVNLEGVLLGYCVLNNYTILFLKGNTDLIYRLEYKIDYLESKLLYSGNLNFNTNNPIESLGTYENEGIQKVYWIDGINQARVVNILKDYSNASNSVFDFIPELKLNETVEVVSDANASGQFPSGVVQYAFTYYNLYGQESNIFYQSDLVYTYRTNRGGSPEETASNGFSITLTNLDQSFDYVRIYSIVRTSINSQPTVKVVADLKVTDTIYYSDNNTAGYNIDPTILLYIGGEGIIPSTITQKDNTLFLGNLKIARRLFSKEAINAVKGKVTFTHKELIVNQEARAAYPYTNLLQYSSSKITSLKSRETYRLGVQFQHITGKWSEALFIEDSKVNILPKVGIIPNNYNQFRYSLIKGLYKIPDSVVKEATSLGYKKARAVIVYPTGSDKEVLCQGVVNSTVYNIRDRESDSPYSQSSWFFRPAVNEATRNDTDEIEALYGSYANYVDYDTVDSTNPSRRTEVGISLFGGGINNVASNYFAIDSNIVTFHSPDIELSNSIDYLSDSSLQFRIVGDVSLHSLLSDRSTTASTGNRNSNDYGFFDKTPNYFYSKGSFLGGRMLLSGINWFGKGKTNRTTTMNNPLGWLISPWQRNDSIINDALPEEGVSNKAAMLQYNRLSNLRVCADTYYYDNVWSPPEGISTVGIFDSNEVTLLKIKTSTDSISYYGNIDKVLTPIDSSGENRQSNIGIVAPIVVGENTNKTINSMFKGTVVPLWTYNTTEALDNQFRYSTGAASMKYKSSKHAVFAFNKSKGNRVLLPTNGTILEGYRYTYDDTAIYDTIKAPRDCLWLGELYRTVSPDSRFGGNNEEALAANIWTIGGPAVSLDNKEVIIEFTEGDTYIQRYDCLKTYPFTLEDQNSVTEILSFYCETQVNIDGRYDKNRGQSNNLAMTPNNFNLINPVYNQRNNFFTYSYIDSNKVSMDVFPNSITWTKEKTLGELTDTWTNITLASTLDLDGDKGEIISLNTYNNEIFCFQRRGLSNILFNSRVQIPTSDGVPIEITNGLKVSGKRYISNSIGCTNKWSIVESPSGLYFMDNETNSLYLFNGQIDSLSDRLGFRQWVSDHNTQLNWDPVNYNNYRSFYDKNNNDVYFTYKDHCLCYSELLGQFTSFMSYEKVPAMFNINSEFFAYKNNKLWEQFKGDYNMFFGEFKPFSFTIVANADEPYDKIFNNLEFRADSWEDNTLLNDVTFNLLEVWNEYQKGTLELTNIIGHPSPLKKKFRVWRTLIPRDSVNKMDRIRNTWAYIKLEMNKPNTYRTEFHDMTVQYFV